MGNKDKTNKDNKDKINKNNMDKPKPDDPSDEDKEEYKEEDSVEDDDDVEEDDEDDEDYNPDEDEDDQDDEDDDKEDEEDDCEEEEYEDQKEDKMVYKNPVIYIMTSSYPMPPPHISNNANIKQNDTKKRKYTHEENEFIKKMDKEESIYWNNINDEERENYLNKIKIIKKNDLESLIPLKFKILSSDIDNNSKSLIISKIEQFQTMSETSSEFYKLKAWLRGLSRLPLNIYNSLPVNSTDTIDKCADFLQNIRDTLDTTVFGHKETKEQIMRIMAQWISNPKSQGNCIGIQGPAGVAKTTLIKEGVCKALKLPFGFISLGGASDGSFLEGHSYTYEGSTYGKISETLMKTQCMNPVLFFDELDKVSNTHRGNEIIGILTHLTDQSQNERFNDRYFGELDLNLSKSLIVFTYNDESLINPILKDRMITINVNGYTEIDKISIANGYLIPSILEQFNIEKDSIVFTDDIIKSIINKVESEEGVRNLKRGIECIISWINIQKYLENKNNNKNKIIVTNEDVNKYLKSKNNNDSISMMYL